MPEKRLPMRQIREVLRLHFEAKLNERQIAKICSVGKGTVRRYLQRVAAAGLSWPLPADLDDATLEHWIFPPPPPAAPGSRPLPDFTVVHKELKSRQNVTLQLLWEEHHQANPEGYNYSCYVAAVFMLRTEPTYWIGALSAAACSNITRGRPDYSPLRKAISEGISVRPGGV